MKAIIPAAGLGTRFLPATKAQPKEMLPVLDKPCIQYVVEEALAAGADEVVIVSNEWKTSIVEHFAPAPQLVELLEAGGKTGLAAAVRAAGQLPVSFAWQPEPRGLGHAVHCAAPFVLGAAGGCAGGAGDAGGAGGAAAADAAADAAGGASAQPFFVLLGDVLVPQGGMLEAMQAVSVAHGGASVIAVIQVPHEQVGRFGVIAGEPLGTVALPTAGAPGAAAASGAAAGEPANDPNAPGSVWRVTSLVEKPPVEQAPSDLAIFGRYLLSPQVMELLASTPPGAGGEIQLTDALVELLASQEMYALVIDPEQGFDVGTIENWLDTNLRLGRRAGLLPPA